MATPGKKPGPKGNRKSTELRRVEAAKLRAKGWSLYEIARKLDVDPSTVWEYIRDYYKALNHEGEEAARTARELDLDRLDRAIKGIEQAIDMGDPQAINALVRVLDRRAKLLGIDAPARSEVTGKDGAPLVEEATPQRIRDVMRTRFGGNVCPEIESEEGTSDGADTGDSPGAE